MKLVLTDNSFSFPLIWRTVFCWKRPHGHHTWVVCTSFQVTLIFLSCNPAHSHCHAISLCLQHQLLFTQGSRTRTNHFIDSLKWLGSSAPDADEAIAVWHLNYRPSLWLNSLNTFWNPKHQEAEAVHMFELCISCNWNNLHYCSLVNKISEFLLRFSGNLKHSVASILVAGKWPPLNMDFDWRCLLY